MSSSFIPLHASPTPAASPTRLRAILMGAGSLGRALLRRLRDHGGPVDLVAVLTAHHGRLVSSDGIEPGSALNLIEGGSLGDAATTALDDVIERVRPNVLIECIPQNIRSGEPALAALRTALDRGVHVITTNKTPIVLGYRDLRHRAAKSGAVFRFESALLDGLPVFSFVSQLRDARITHVRGVLNATSSIVLESVAMGSTRSRGLARAQAQGVAEADSILDLDGWDAAAKAALVANVWMGGALRVVDVHRTGCDAIKDEKIREAAAANLRYRLVAEVEKKRDNVVTASVAPVALEPGDPLYSLHGSASGMTLTLDGGPRFTLLQETSGLDDAATGILADAAAILAGAPQI